MDGRIYVTAYHILLTNEEFGNIFKGTALISVDSNPKFAYTEKQETKSLKENGCFSGFQWETKPNEYESERPN
jgi:hypothetical protein